LFSLYPHQFEVIVNIALKTKPKKRAAKDAEGESEDKKEAQKGKLSELEIT